MTTMIEEARVALAAKGVAEQNLAQLALCPPWRHAAFASVMAALVGSAAVPLPARFILLVAIYAAIGAIYLADRRRLGVFINGYRRGKTRVVAFSMLGIVLVLGGASLYFGDRGQRPVCVALAAVAFGVAYQGSVIWQRVFRRELGA